MQDIDVFIFLGFLDGGKTTFIQDSLQDPRLDDVDRTLILVCEEGEAELEPSKFKVKNVAIEYIEESDLNQKYLDELTKKHDAKRVIVEYNGMWLLDKFFEAMPESWVISQMMTFVDSGTFLGYNQNMRQLVYDKIQMTQMVIFNRFLESYSKEEFHKIVRAISRRCDIVYEDPKGKTELDEIDDPLPYDINAPVIELEDRDFAYFYRDICENTENYNGKTIHFKGIAAVQRNFPKGYIVIGRHIMTCCEADTQYEGLALKVGNASTKIKHAEWLDVTAKVVIERNAIYRERGPVFYATAIKRTAPLPREEIVATFY